MIASLTIRMAGPQDAVALRRLSVLDSSDSFPVGPAVVAEVDDELWAAASLVSAEVIADPFRPSAEVAFMVSERARQITATERRNPGRRRRLPRWLGAPAARLS